jgi:hypothetical protein
MEAVAVEAVRVEKLAKKALAMRRFREKHGESLRRRMREYYAANRGRIREQERLRYAKSPAAKKAAAEQYRALHPEWKIISRLRKYGLTPAALEEMRAAQGNACAICARPFDDSKRRFRLSIDHDHTTGAVRALLCQSCNSILGYAYDSPATLRTAVTYLERFGR